MVAEATGDALTLFPRGPVAGSPRRTVYKHTCVKVPLSLISNSNTNGHANSKENTTKYSLEMNELEMRKDSVNIAICDTCLWHIQKFKNETTQKNDS